MILGIASGKGGTGKTTIAVNLARVMGSPVQLLDCDVEEPNDHLFLKGALREQATVTLPVPEVDASLCDGCGECSRFCQYHAIVSIAATPIVFPELCHSCGGCALVCPRGAIRERDQRIGSIVTVESDNVTLIQGRIDVGVALAPPLIRAAKSRMTRDLPAILDAPPGTSCPVIAALRGADFAALVTEPTPFGLHDLTLAVEMVRELRIPFGVVINRLGMGDDRVHAFCRREGVPLLLEIPDDRRIAEAYSQGSMIIDAVPEYRSSFETLLGRIPGLLITKEV
jgi:MinD superfamily P-loop ATPase